MFVLAVFSMLHCGLRPFQWARTEENRIRKHRRNQVRVCGVVLRTCVTVHAVTSGLCCLLQRWYLTRDE